MPEALDQLNARHSDCREPYNLRRLLHPLNQSTPTQERKLFEHTPRDRNYSVCSDEIESFRISANLPDFHGYGVDCRGLAFRHGGISFPLPQVALNVNEFHPASYNIRGFKMT